jgi:ATP-dependent Clp protease, protease subunit
MPVIRLNEVDTPPAEPAGDRSLIDEKLFSARTVLVFGTITDALAARTCRSLLALAAESDKPVSILVSSPGGHVESGDAIHDVIRFIDLPVSMIGSGWVGSAATHLFLAAPKARRFCTPQTRFLIHQPSSGAYGRASEIAIQAAEIVKTRERIAKVIADETGQSLERVRTDIERDYWMSASEAIDYGLVAKIVKNRGSVPAH